MYSPINHYQSMQVTTASPERLLVMLCDGAVNFARIAQDKMSLGDIGGKGTYISKALGIVTELTSTLDHEAGGEIAGNLDRLYTYVIGELMNANINNDPKALENATAILSTLRDTWTEAVEIAKQDRCDNSEARLRGGRNEY